VGAPQWRPARGLRGGPGPAAANGKTHSSLRCKQKCQDRFVDSQVFVTLHPLGRRIAMPSQEEIYTKVSATLVEALNVDEDDIQPTATLQGDLGAESIDLLDIVFRLEREFDVKIPRGELFPESIFQGDPEFVQDGRVTANGLAELRARMPFADLSRFEQKPEVSAIGDLFTVALITRYIEGKLGQPCGNSRTSTVR
jgi:acyl carrier protein